MPLLTDFDGDIVQEHGVYARQERKLARAGYHDLNIDAQLACRSCGHA